ncbi:hypothetical protein BASA50_001850 [Batrachochytrium salamandrivorans]|uniref:Ribosome biogenesis protein SLX9 n=1 Tax=Batrachochytrium salamandrivorans TaxID=1357716 RepID=A0ABQ8FN91_9FUNG|nr:hypothetical protein BASA62_008680 [Batrachochytrium salamandrivorans]KAH6582099.1 hypothetical protein BASA60_002150 [Batrachochytrium salamandrivorans]KAH6591182.1 hypothetical protein BASA61_005036 [Batrachochytrium salamandrivorans]KAH6601171.1 hypothetical protein BASA50_001850 [Batrachochytrium salamandrivorans]KAH9246969.1 hypothetical protein BASA81_015454 [Batrachochytrium salamandrivorans]
MPDAINRSRGTRELDHRSKKLRSKQLRSVDGKSIVMQSNARIENLDEAITVATERVVARRLLTSNGEPDHLTEKQKQKQLKRVKLVTSVRPGRVGKNSAVSMPNQLSKKKVKKLLQAAKFELKRTADKQVTSDKTMDVDMA